MNWRDACILPLYKVRFASMYVVTQEVHISLFSEVGRLYSRVLIKRVRD